MMPPFTERESIVQQTLSKKQADSASTMPAKAKAEGAGGAVDVGDDGEPPPVVVQAAAVPNLMGDDPPPTSAAADLLGDLSLGGGAPAPPPAQPAAPLVRQFAARQAVG